MALSHGRNNYARGCRCSVCREAQREFPSGQRARRRAKGLTPMPVEIRNSESPQVAPSVGQSADGDGPVVSALRAEFERLPAAQVRPDLAAIGVAMARILDNNMAISTQPSACRQLVAVLDILHNRTAAPRGRLRAIEAMAPSRPDAG